MVYIDRKVFTGESPFPEHVKWSASWFHLIAERLPQIAWWKPAMNLLVRTECVIRRVTEKFEPRCTYNETKAWHQEEWPATGIDSFGPTV